MRVYNICMSKYPELEEAIEKMRSEGYQEDFIKKESLKSGYTEEELKNSLDSLKSQKKKRNRFIFYGISAYIIFGIAAYLYWNIYCGHEMSSGGMFAGLGCAILFGFLFIVSVSLFFSSFFYFCFCFLIKNISYAEAVAYFVISLILGGVLGCGFLYSL